MPIDCPAQHEDTHSVTRAWTCPSHKQMCSRVIPPQWFFGAASPVTLLDATGGPNLFPASVSGSSSFVPNLKLYQEGFILHFPWSNFSILFLSDCGPEFIADSKNLACTAIRRPGCWKDTLFASSQRNERKAVWQSSHRGHHDRRMPYQENCLAVKPEDDLFIT